MIDGVKGIFLKIINFAFLIFKTGVRFKQFKAKINLENKFIKTFEILVFNCYTYRSVRGVLYIFKGLCLKPEIIWSLNISNSHWSVFCFFHNQVK